MCTQNRGKGFKDMDGLMRLRGHLWSLYLVKRKENNDLVWNAEKWILGIDWEEKA